MLWYWPAVCCIGPGVVVLLRGCGTIIMPGCMGAGTVPSGIGSGEEFVRKLGLLIIITGVFGGGKAPLIVGEWKVVWDLE